MKFITLLTSLTAWAGPSNFVYQGQIIKPDGQPLEATNVQFTIDIISPGAESCLLYSENHTINMNSSNGVFSIEVGSGARSGVDYHDTNPLATALSNNTGLVTPTDCLSVGTYTPSGTDGRLVSVTFDDGSGPNTLSQDHNLVSVPYSHEALQIAGLGASDLLQVNTGGSLVLSQANLENIFDTTNHTELLALIGGTSTQYLTTAPTANINANSQRLINVATPTGGNDATNKDYVDTSIVGENLDPVFASLGAGQDGQALTWDNGNNRWTLAASSGDNLGDHTATTDLNLDNNNITNLAPGTAAAPSLSFNGASTTGIFGSAGTIGFSTSGTSGVYLNANGMRMGFSWLSRLAGSQTSPQYTFNYDGNTGMYSSTADTLEFTTGGVEKLRIDSAGNVGVGSTSPRNKLDVNGAISSGPASAEAANTIDFANSNLGYTSQSCGAATFNLHNMKDGSTYTLAVQGTTSGTCAFNAFSDAGTTALTLKLPPGHGASTAATETLYSFVVIGTSVYVAWIPGY